MRRLLHSKPKSKPANVITIHEQLVKSDKVQIAAGELLRAMKNTKAWLVRNKLHCPPISLTGIDKAIAQAEAAGIEAPSVRAHSHD